MRAYPNGSAHSVTWASAQARSAEVKGHRNRGFFGHMRNKLSSNLPRFNTSHDRDYADKEKLGRGRWSANNGNMIGGFLSRMGRMVWRMRLRALVVLAFLFLISMFYITRKCDVGLLKWCRLITCSAASDLQAIIVPRWG